MVTQDGSKKSMFTRSVRHQSLVPEGFLYADPGSTATESRAPAGRGLQSISLRRRFLPVSSFPQFLRCQGEETNDDGLESGCSAPDVSTIPKALTSSPDGPVDEFDKRLLCNLLAAGQRKRMVPCPAW